MAILPKATTAIPLALLTKPGYVQDASPLLYVVYFLPYIVCAVIVGCILFFTIKIIKGAKKK